VRQQTEQNESPADDEHALIALASAPASITRPVCRKRVSHISKSGEEMS